MTYFDIFNETFTSNGITYLDIYNRLDIQNFSDYLYDYEINGNETPEIIANKLWGDKRLFWILLVINNINDYFYDWPLQQKQLIELANTIKENAETGDIEEEYTEQEIFELLYNENENKKTIKVFDLKYMNTFLKKINEL